MFRSRFIGLGLIGILFVIIFAGSGSFRALNQDFLNLIYPLEGGACPTTQTGTTLSCWITAQGSNQRILLISPGTWTIGSNLTIPANIQVWVAPNGVLSVNSGITLTINGTFWAPNATIFSGAGSVVFGTTARLEGGVRATWFGAACDGSTNDASALQRAIDTADASETFVSLPDRGTCRVTSAVSLRANVDIVGRNKFSSIIEVCGAGVKGLVFEPASFSGFEATLKGFKLQGCDATVGDLISFARAGRIYMEDLFLFRTGDDAISLNNSIEVEIKDTILHSYTGNGVRIENSSNTVTLNKISIQSELASQYGVLIENSAFITIGDNSVFEGYGSLGGPFMGYAGIGLNGARSITIDTIFIEWYQFGIQAAGAASRNIRILNSHLHDATCDTGDNSTVNFNLENLVHENVTVVGNHFVQCSTDVGFHPGATINWRLEHSTREGPGGVYLPMDNQTSQMVNYATPFHHQGHFKVTDAFEPANTDAEVSRIISWKQPLDFGTTPAGFCEVQGMGGIIGVHDNDPCFVGVPLLARGGSGSDGVTQGVSYTCEVSFPDNGVPPGFGAVAVRRCNHTGLPLNDLAPIEFKFVIIKTQIPPNPG